LIFGINKQKIFELNSIYGRNKKFKKLLSTRKANKHKNKMNKIIILLVLVSVGFKMVFSEFKMPNDDSMKKQWNQFKHTHSKYFKFFFYSLKNDLIYAFS
jgi:hypothetical protein